MIAFDTNLLVRFYTQDDPEQASRVNSLVADAEKDDTPILVCDVVICELVWVLKDCYDQSSAEIADILERMLRTPRFVFQNKDQLWAALGDYRAGKAGFADYLIGRTCRAGGAGKTYTFDRALKGSPLFEMLG